MTSRIVSRIIIVAFVTITLIWCGTKLTTAAESYKQASIDRMAKIDSIFDKN